MRSSKVEVGADETLDRGCQCDRNYHRSFRSTGGTSPVRSGVSALLDGRFNDGPDDEMAVAKNVSLRNGLFNFRDLPK